MGFDWNFSVKHDGFIGINYVDGMIIWIKHGQGDSHGHYACGRTRTMVVSFTSWDIISPTTMAM